MRLDAPQLALENLEGIIVIDEIQRKPEIFPLLRYLTDNRPNQRYIILGSASRELINQSSETLTGRIGFHYLGGFRFSDVGTENAEKLWLRGGFPRSFTAENDNISRTWREAFISTFIERDIPQLGIKIPSSALMRFWMMLSHYHGQILNFSELGRSFGISDMTASKYCEILEGTFMIRLLRPWFQNISKRLVKRPKLYFRDSGILHTLLNIETLEQLRSHNKLGASWEGFALETAARSVGKDDNVLHFWGTHSGAELDLFWQHGGKNWGIECKYCDAPALTKSMKSVLDDLKLEKLWVVYPGDKKYSIDKNVTALPLNNISGDWEY